MKMHKYLWQVVDQQISGKIELGKTPAKGARLVDLMTGTRFVVQRLTPDCVIHARPAGRLSQQDLDRLREQAGYIADEYCQTDIVFET